MQKELVFVTPYGAPGTNGICDHVTALVNALGHDSNVVIRRVAVSPGIVPQDASYFALVEKNDSAGLEKALDRAVSPDSYVFVHYVNYGFDRRGCPFGLLHALQSLRKQKSFHLITMFHELAASGPPWKSACYTGPFQTYVWRQIAMASDIVATSAPSYKKRIQKCRPQIQTHPVFSNIGEPLAPPSFAERPNRAVIFGHRNTRRHVLLSPLLTQTILRLGVDEVVEIGAPHNLPVPSIRNVRWTVAGELSARRVSDLLLTSRFGLLQYSPALLPKSGIFAAYSSHRVAPILFWPKRGEAENLQAGIHFLKVESLTHDLAATAPSIADEAWHWYRDTWSLAQCTALYLRWIHEPIDAVEVSEHSHSSLLTQAH